MSKKHQTIGNKLLEKEQVLATFSQAVLWPLHIIPTDAVVLQTNHPMCSTPNPPTFRGN